MKLRFPTHLHITTKPPWTRTTLAWHVFLTTWLSALALVWLTWLVFAYTHTNTVDVDTRSHVVCGVIALATLASGSLSIIVLIAATVASLYLWQIEPLWAYFLTYFLESGYKDLRRNCEFTWSYHGKS